MSEEDVFVDSTFDAKKMLEDYEATKKKNKTMRTKVDNFMRKICPFIK